MLHYAESLLDISQHDIRKDFLAKKKEEDLAKEAVGQNAMQSTINN